MKTRRRKQFEAFFGFLIFGVVLGFAENVLALKIVTDHAIDAQAIVVSLLVVTPFAAIGELIVDRRSLLPRVKSRVMQHLEVFLEFFVFGVVMGIVEDLIVVTLLTGTPITLELIGIITLITLPFAALGEIIVDRKDWFAHIKTKSKRRWA